MMFERMMSKDEALFGNGDHAVIVFGVPSDRFTAGEYEILVAGTVKGNRSWKNSFGGELMVPLLKYIDSIDVRFSDEDLNWAKAQAGLE